SHAVTLSRGAGLGVEPHRRRLLELERGSAALVLVRGDLDPRHAAPAQSLRVSRDESQTVLLALKKNPEILRRGFVRESGAHVAAEQIAHRALLLALRRAPLGFLDGALAEGEGAVENPAHERENRQREHDFDQSKTARAAAQAGFQISWLRAFHGLVLLPRRRVFRSASRSRRSLKISRPTSLNSQFCPRSSAPGSRTVCTCACQRPPASNLPLSSPDNCLRARSSSITRAPSTADSVRAALRAPRRRPREKICSRVTTPRARIVSATRTSIKVKPVGERAIRMVNRRAPLRPAR